MSQDTPTQPPAVGEVILAPAGTLMAEWQKERTDAMTAMFEAADKDKSHPIFRTSEFYARIDAAVGNLLAIATHCTEDIDGRAICGTKLDCHIHNWRSGKSFHPTRTGGGEH